MASRLKLISFPQVELDHFPVLFQWGPLCLLAEIVGYVELDDLCHRPPPALFSETLDIAVPGLATGPPHYMEAGSLPCALRRQSARSLIGKNHLNSSPVEIAGTGFLTGHEPTENSFLQ